MRYIVLVTRKQTKAERFAAAIQGDVRNATVYVVGLDDTEALAQALTGELEYAGEIAEALGDGVVEIDSDLDAKAALKFKYVEAIGTEDDRTPLSFLITAAKDLANEITKVGGHEGYKLRMQKFTARG